MAYPAPRLFADDRGVWRESTRGQLAGTEWDQVYRVSGHKVDGISELYTCVVLDFEYGKFVELYHDWPGFRQVVEAITERLPGINPDWLLRVERLDVDDPPLEVWCRVE